MFDAMLAFNLVEHLAGAAIPGGRVGYQRILSPFRGPHRTRDGYLAVMPYSDRDWKALRDAVGRAGELGQPAKATEALDLYGQWATASGQPWAAAILQRCRALVGPAAEADCHYAEALRLHQHSGRPFEWARTQLLYGEWLRRERRRADARAQLAAAAATFERLGAAPWAQRARGELRTAGQRSLPQPAKADPASQLTPQELHIVRLAAAGASNRDIAAKLFLSPRC